MASSSPPRKPVKPLPADCCGTGCSRCVYDIYDQQLRQYRRWLDAHPDHQPTEGQTELDKKMLEPKHRPHTKLKVRDNPDQKPFSPFD